jgi:hypothetical protein
MYVIMPSFFVEWKSYNVPSFLWYHSWYGENPCFSSYLDCEVSQHLVHRITCDVFLQEWILQFAELSASSVRGGVPAGLTNSIENVGNSFERGHARRHMR